MCVWWIGTGGEKKSKRNRQLRAVRGGIPNPEFGLGLGFWVIRLGLRVGLGLGLFGLGFEKGIPALLLLRHESSEVCG